MPTEQFIVEDPSEIGTWNLPAYLGIYKITIFARDCDDDRTLAIDSLTTELTSVQELIDDDITAPILYDFSIEADFLNLDVSFNAIDDNAGDDQGINLIKISIDDELIISYNPTDTDTSFEFILQNEWIMEFGIHHVKIEIWDADNDRGGDSLSTTICGTFEVSLEEMKKFLDWEISNLNSKLQESLDVCWRKPLDNRKVAINEKLNELKMLISSNHFNDAYDKLFHDIKPKLTGLKTEENENPWGNGVFDNPWVTCAELQEELRLDCNEILINIQILIGIS